MKASAFLSRLFLRQYKIKLFCFLSALFFWFYITIENSYEYVTDVPLRVANAPEGWMLLRPLPTHTKVLFKGSGRSYVSFGFRERRLEVDLRKVPNNARVPLTADMIKGLPAGVRVLSILDPEDVTVSWDRLAERRIPVRSRLEFLPADGYTLVGPVRFEPDTVRIAGPQSVVDSVQEAWTEARSFQGLIKEVRDRASLSFESTKALDYSAETVRFAMDVQRIGERLMEGIPVSVIHVPDGRRVNVRPPTLSLKLQGGADLLGGLKNEDIVAAVDYRMTERYGMKRIPAMIQIPRDIEFSDVEPKFFELAE